ncbi:MAG: DUF1289 domain-containing protein [Pikeienuella sp.]
MTDQPEPVWSRSEIDSPCVKICMLHPETGLCIGCSRSGDEIAAWSRLSPQERRRIMAELDGREVAPRSRRGGASARRRAD